MMKLNLNPDFWSSMNSNFVLNNESYKCFGQIQCIDCMLIVPKSPWQNSTVNKNVKPQILSVFGDIAMAIGPLFKDYIEFVMTTLMQASQTQVDKVGTVQQLHVFHYMNVSTQNK